MIKQPKRLLRWGMPRRVRRIVRRELMEMLKDTGFTKVERMPYGKSQVEGLAIEQEWRAEESLHVEAVK